MTNSDAWTLGAASAFAMLFGFALPPAIQKNPRLACFTWILPALFLAFFFWGTSRVVGVVEAKREFFRNPADLPDERGLAEALITVPCVVSFFYSLGAFLGSRTKYWRSRYKDDSAKWDVQSLGLSDHSIDDRKTE
jgi:hypothetical protein